MSVFFLSFFFLFFYYFFFFDLGISIRIFRHGYFTGESEENKKKIINLLNDLKYETNFKEEEINNICYELNRMNNPLIYKYINCCEEDVKVYQQQVCY
jgi:hypothetical protein